MFLENLNVWDKPRDHKSYFLTGIRWFFYGNPLVAYNLTDMPIFLGNGFMTTGASTNGIRDNGNPNIFWFNK